MHTKPEVLLDTPFYTLVKCGCGKYFEYLADQVNCPACGVLFPLAEAYGDGGISWAETRSRLGY